MQADNPPTKLTLDELRTGMRVFLDSPVVEQEIQNLKNQRLGTARFVAQVNIGEPGTDGDIINLLQVATANEYKERLQFLLATSAGSLEVLDRVCMVICPEHTTWNARRQSVTATRAIARFLINPDTEPRVPWYIRERLRLPADFLNLVETSIAREIHGALQSQYNTSSGQAVEGFINDLVARAGYTYGHGPVELVDNKEVDVVVPDDLAAPRLLIMASYNLTTSSGQSQRAREQETMYHLIRQHNQRRNNQNRPAVQFVNVVDGGGWLSRPNDLDQMHRHCDYALSVAQLPQHLPPILRYHMEQ